MDAQSPDKLTNSPENEGGRKEVSFRGYKLLDEVKRQNLWRNKDDKGNLLYNDTDRVVDPAKIIETATALQIPKADAEQAARVELPPLNELEQMSQQALRACIHQAIQEGVLTADQVNLAYRMTRPQDVKIISRDDLGFTGGLNLDTRYDNSLFPDEGGDHLTVTVSDTVVKNRINHYRELAEKAGAALTQDQLLKAALGSLTFHEWTHSLERAFQTQALKILKSSPTYDDNKDYWTVYGASQDIIAKHAREVSMPIVPGLQESNYQLTHIEQFATGMELEAIRMMLEQSGVDRETAKELSEAAREERATRLKDFQSLKDNLGMDDLATENLTGDIRRVLLNNQLDSGYIPSLWKDLGYLKGYTQTETKVMVQKAWEDLQA